MRLVLRVYAIAAALAWSVGNAMHDETALHVQKSGPSVQRWMNVWMEEACGQCTPVPQLLYIQTRPWEDYPLRSVESDGRLDVTSGFRDRYNSNFGYRYKIFQAGGAHWVRKVEFILRSVVWDVPDEEFGAFPRNCDSYSPRLPVFSLRPPQAHAEGFHWLKNVHAPFTTRPMAVFLAQCTDDNPFKLNIPRRLSVYGDDLRLFEDSVNRMLNDPNLPLWDQGGASQTMLFFKLCPPEQDEMFSKLIHSSE